MGCIRDTDHLLGFKDFTLKKAQDVFQIETVAMPGIFAGADAKAIRRHLADILKENIPLATSINTEKARSE
ncbi:MAG: hypothetical protein LGR52_11555, partial [Candidatus Thiosymbion ectosymbiont of Robbea hypermnestra]|nr:hypothetical protein [Candidatus Thiosymbion ectosymbiont of Robbea hypermnestra]